MRLARHVVLMDKIKNTISGLVGKYEEEEYFLDDLYLDQKKYIKMVVK